MIQPIELRKTLPMKLHGGAVSTTTKVWEMLSASRDGDLDHVLRLIAGQPELSTCQYNYTPPLHLAIREGHLPLVRTLLAHKALDPGYKSYPFGDSFLTIAQDRGRLEIVALLEETLANPKLTRKWVDTGEIEYELDDTQKEFDRAVHEGELDQVQRLLAKRPELALNEMSSWAEGVLMMPANRANRPLLELLMRFGARVPEVSKWCRYYYFKHDEIAAFLMDSGMSARHMNWQGVTLLHDMAQAGDIAKARLLLDRGADLDAVDDEYRSTPLGLAARWGRKAMVAYLLERGADPNKAGAAWSTPLAWARKQGHAEIERFLIGAGAAGL